MSRLTAVVSAVFALGFSAAAAASPRVTDIRLEPAASGVNIVVEATEPLTFQSWTSASPNAVVVDLLDTTATAGSKPGSGPVNKVEITRHDGKSSPMTRLTLPTSAGQDYEVNAVGNTLTIAVFGKGTRADVKTAAPRVRVASASDHIVDGELGRATATDAVQIAQATGGARQMTYIGFRNSPTQGRVFARLNDSAEFAVRKEGDSLVVLEIKNATIPLRNNRNHLDASAFYDSPVKMITPSEIEDATPTIRIVIEMKAAVPFETKVEGREIAIYFKK
jgi:hypothetical protein